MATSPPSSPTKGWKHLPHGADLGLRGFGPSPAAAFEQAALALTAAVCAPSSVAQRQEVEIACEAPDVEILFFDWLNAVIFEMATRHMLFSAYSVSIAGGTLRATAKGEPVERARHQPAVEVKAATLADLHVEERDGTWSAQCVVDV